MYKKLWVQLNRLKNRITVSVGDMYNSQDQALLCYDFDNDYTKNRHDSWTKQEDTFHLPNGSENNKDKSLKPLNILSIVKKMNVDVEVGGKKDKQTIDDFLTIKFMKNIKKYHPVLEPNPSVLDLFTAPLADMPKEIQILYGYLKDCNLTNLPGFKAKNSQLVQKEVYGDWRDLRFAIQESLVKPWGYADAKKTRPIGILNHLYYMKMKIGDEEEKKKNK